MADRRALVGSVLGASAALSYGVTVVIGRELAKAHLPPADALGLRFGIAGMLLVALLLISRRRVLPEPGERVRVFLFGAAGYAVESTFFYSGLARGTAAAVTLLFYSYPAVVTVADLVITRRRPAPRLVLALALAAGGAGVIAAGSGDVAISGAGVVFSLAAAASFAVYLIAGDRLLHRTDSMRIAAGTAVGASASLLTFAVVRGQIDIPADRWWQLLIYGGATASAFAFMFAALRRLGSQRTSVLLTLEAVFAIVLAAIFLGEQLGTAQAVGGAAVLAAAIIISLTPLHPPIETAAEPP
ncbi:MAG TPA: DMT family transporter [Acidimicrobiales bacterium]|nr:DMT family transporter [Acidimicrobiales bacterium]